MHYTRLLSIVLLAVVNLDAVSAASLQGSGHGSAPRHHRIQRRQGARRTTALLKDFKGQAPLPTMAEVSATNTSGSALNLANIQGDILVGMKTPVESFFFFSITDADAFKASMKSDILPLITSAAELISPPAEQPNAYVNVAFSQAGLTALGITDDLGDSFFTNGQFADAAKLKDDTSTWESEFQGTDVHGVFLVGSDQSAHIDDTFNGALDALQDSMTLIYKVEGSARPGDQAGHEHFGYLDGVSQPGVTGFTTSPNAGQSVVDPGIILTGETGDNVARPDWALDGSFMAFRKLKQLVPEYNKYLLDNAIQDNAHNLTTEEGASLLGARIFGRWKSGAPLDLAPLADDPELGADPARNNDFDFSHTDLVTYDLTSDQSRCPFSAHIRKTRPRADLAGNVINQAIRAGIPYGPETTADELASNTTASDRGLAFVMYQSNIGNGFRTQQITWANNAGFVFGKNISSIGLDLVIGQNGGSRAATGLDPLDYERSFTMNQVVISNGGEYFFTPSISALNSTILA